MDSYSGGFRHRATRLATKGSRDSALLSIPNHPHCMIILVPGQGEETVRFSFGRRNLTFRNCDGHGLKTDRTGSTRTSSESLTKSLLQFCVKECDNNMTFLLRNCNSIHYKVHKVRLLTISMKIK